VVVVGGRGSRVDDSKGLMTNLIVCEPDDHWFGFTDYSIKFIEHGLSPRAGGADVNSGDAQDARGGAGKLSRAKRAVTVSPWQERRVDVSLVSWRCVGKHEKSPIIILLPT
jgi:hypothetical protein